MTRRKPDGANTNNDLDELRRRVSAFCDEAGYRLSPRADDILKDIVGMKQRTGDFYCTCQPRQLPETVCVCQPVRNGLVDIMGACFCALIISKNESEE